MNPRSILDALEAEASAAVPMAGAPGADPVAEARAAVPTADAAAAPRVPAASLASLAPGDRAIVRHIRADQGFARRLMELGLIPGTEVALVREAPLGDPIELVVRGSHFSIRRSEAERIHVDAL